MAAEEPDNQVTGAPSTPHERSPLSVALWLIAAGLIVMLLPLSLVASTIRGQAAVLNATLTSIRQSQASVPTPLPEVQQLIDSLTQVREQTHQVQAIYPTLTAPRTNWAAVMATLGNYHPDQIALTSLVQAGNQVTLSGEAVDDAVVADYVRALDASGQFARVVLQSVQPITAPANTTPLTPTLGPAFNLPIEFVIRIETKAAAP